LIEAVIRPARLEDAEALQAGCYPQASLEEVSDYLAWCLRQAQKGRITRLVADVGGRAVGNAQLTIWGDVGEIGSVVVAPAYRRQGLARRLIAELIGEAQRRELAVLEICASLDQPETQAFYEGLGFRPVDKKSGPVWPAYLERCVLLRLPLKGHGGRSLGTIKDNPGNDVG
jgi:N-acetylglutamate synthase-like GNAT family acetyltransferase